MIASGWCGDGRSVWNGGGSRGVYYCNCTDYKHDHPTQKPEKLIMELTNLFSNEEAVIFDPFCGSGTTCVAAKRLGRRYIGIDISPEYCDIARKRLEAEEKGITVKELEKGQGALFAD